jgi:hypothetical protein
MTAQQRSKSKSMNYKAASLELAVQLTGHPACMFVNPIHDMKHENVKIQNVK